MSGADVPGVRRGPTLDDVPAPSPVLVAVAHGTRDPEGTAETRRLLDRVRAARPGLDVREAYVDVRPPAPADVLAGIDAPAVLVPVLLSAGYHVGVDLPAAAATARGPVAVAAPLGPDELLAALLHQRLEEAGGGDADTVVLAAAGSSDPAAAADVTRLAHLLEARVRRPVRTAYASAASPKVPCALATERLRGTGRVAVATYLIAPGFFSRRVADAAHAAGAVVSAPLGADDLLVELVLRRYDAAALRLVSSHAVPVSA